MPDQPVISVGLPVYNGARYLDEAITSILEQDVRDLELVISDNGSTDDTVAIIERRAAADSRIRAVFREDNKGAAWNFNNVLRLARGPYFHWSGADDRMEKTMLRRCLEALQQKEEAVLAYPGTRLIDQRGDLIREFDNRLNLPQADAAARVRHYLRNVGLANAIFGVLRTDVLRAVGGLGTYPSADLVTLARLAMRGNFVEIPEPLFLRRMHSDQSWQRVGLDEGFAEWFDTSRKRKIVFSNWRVFGELSRACLVERLPPGQKVRCLSAVAYWFPRRRWKRLMQEPFRIVKLVRRPRGANHSTG